MAGAHAGGDQVGTGKGLALQFDAHRAVVQHQHAVAEAEQFFVVAAVEENRRAGLAQSIEQAVDLALAPTSTPLVGSLSSSSRGERSSHLPNTIFWALPPLRLLTGSSSPAITTRRSLAMR